MRTRNFDEYMSKLAKMWNILNQYKVEIGVFSNDSNRPDEEYTYDISNAQLMFIHENGTMENGGYIPPRPVLGLTIEKSLKTFLPFYLNKIEKAILDDIATTDIIEKLLKQMCMEMESYARNIIGKNDGRLQRNAPSTIKAKGYNHPLQVTGQLKKSITCQLVKKTI